MELSAKDMAANLFEAAKTTDGFKEFHPYELMTLEHAKQYQEMRTAVCFHFHKIWLKNKDVVQKVRPGIYIRVGGNKPLVSGKKGRMVMEF